MDEDVGSEERENKKPEVPTMIISDVRFPLHAVGWQVEGPSCKTKTEAGAVASVILGFGWDAAVEPYPGRSPTKHSQNRHPIESRIPQQLDFLCNEKAGYL